VAPLGVDPVAVPEFEAAEGGGAVVEADLVDEHLRRRQDPRQVARCHVAHLSHRTTPRRTTLYSSAGNVTLLAFAAVRRAAAPLLLGAQRAAAVDRYLQQARRSAANPGE